MNSDPYWKSRVYLIGALIGLLTGVGAAAILIQRAEEEGGRPRLDAGSGIKLGLSVLGLFRLVTQFYIVDENE